MEGLTKTPTGHTRIPWLTPKDSISKPKGETRKAGREIAKTGKEVTEKDSDGIGESGQEAGKAREGAAEKVGNDKE